MTKQGDEHTELLCGGVPLVQQLASSYQFIIKRDDREEPRASKSPAQECRFCTCMVRQRMQRAAKDRTTSSQMGRPHRACSIPR